MSRAPLLAYYSNRSRGAAPFTSSFLSSGVAHCLFYAYAHLAPSSFVCTRRCVNVRPRVLILVWYYCVGELASLCLAASSVREAYILKRCLGRRLEWVDGFVSLAVLFTSLRCWYNLCTCVLLRYGASPFDEVLFVYVFHIILPCVLVVYICGQVDAGSNAVRCVGTTGDAILYMTNNMRLKVCAYAACGLLSAISALAMNNGAREHLRLRDEEVTRQRVQRAIDTLLPAVSPSSLDDICAICCAPSESVVEKWRKLACGHAFHEDCILAWFNRKTRCPLCREEVALF